MVYIRNKKEGERVKYYIEHSFRLPNGKIKKISKYISNYKKKDEKNIIEKYTLLLASGIIVPLVLGLIVGLVQGMDFSGIEEFGIGTNVSQRKELLGTALIAIQAYIAEYSIIASVFVSNQEGNIKKAIIYALILLPLSLIVFSAAKTF